MKKRLSIAMFSISIFSMFSTLIVVFLYFYIVQKESPSILQNSYFPLFIVLIIILFIAITVISQKLVSFLMKNMKKYDEFVPFIRKIAKQKTQILKQSKTLNARISTIETLIQNMREGLVLLDKNKCVILANTSALNIFENFDWDYMGCNILEFTRSTKISDIFNENSENNEIISINFKKTTKTFEILITPILSDSSKTGYIMLLLDKTKKILATNSTLEFSANISHELKTPLTAIYGFAELISNDMAPDNSVFAKKIMLQSENLLKLINDILESSQQRSPIFTNFDIFTLINKIITDLFCTSEIIININGSETYIYADIAMMQTVVENIIGNAIKYSCDDSYKKAKLDINISTHNDNVILEFIDNGIGISKNDIKKVFSRFYRASNIKKIQGNGLGLSIVHDIISLHSGKIVLSSDENIGTSIKIIL